MDSLLAAVCAVVSIVTVLATDDPQHGLGLDDAGAALLVLQCAPVAVRRVNPVVAWVVAGAAAAAYGVGEFPDTVLDVGPLIVIYTVAADAPRRVATVLGVLTGVSILAALAYAGDADAKDFSFNILVYAVAWVAGEHQRARDAARTGAAAAAVTGERARIAHELHDVVAHHVSMMVVQAEGGASVVAAAPERAAEAFDAISATGREAMTELRRVLGVLREPDEGGSAALAPQPGLAALGGVVERVGQAGVRVDVRTEGIERALPATVDLSALRIIQEALTNSVRHGRAAHATVVVRYLDGAVEVEVVDDGTGGAAGAGNGHGLLGMRERAAAFGGSLDAGPRPGGKGFAVTARLPAP